jgi:hypothetical protein
MYRSALTLVSDHRRVKRHFSLTGSAMSKASRESLAIAFDASEGDWESLAG